MNLWEQEKVEFPALYLPHNIIVLLVGSYLIFRRFQYKKPVKINLVLLYFAISFVSTLIFSKAITGQFILYSLEWML